MSCYDCGRRGESICHHCRRYVCDTCYRNSHKGKVCLPDCEECRRGGATICHHCHSEVCDRCYDRGHRGRACRRPRQHIQQPTFAIAHPEITSAYVQWCNRDGNPQWLRNCGQMFAAVSRSAGPPADCVVVEAANIQANYIVLRPPNTQAMLVIGCGNSPDQQEVIDAGHEHADAVTLDPNILMNPTIVASFGDDANLLNAFGGHTFDVIVFEGTVPSGQHLHTLLQHLLNDGGVVILMPANTRYEKSQIGSI